MPCKDPTHTHKWPISGVHTFQINSCERECDWCPETQRGRLQKNASNLRHHAQTHINNAENTHLHGIKIARERAGRRKLITKGAKPGPLKLPSVDTMINRGPPSTPPDVRLKSWDLTQPPVTHERWEFNSPSKTFLRHSALHPSTNLSSDSHLVREASFPIEGNPASKDLQAKAAQAANGLYMLAGSQPRGDFTSVDGQILKKPAGSNADGVTYTCTYHGCTLRFEGPAKLQKHKREDHKQSAPLTGSDRFSIGPEYPPQDRYIELDRRRIQQRSILENQLSLTPAERSEGIEHPVDRDYSVLPFSEVYSDPTSAATSPHSSRASSPPPSQMNKAAQENGSEQETRLWRSIQMQEQWSAQQADEVVQKTQLEKSSHPVGVDSNGFPMNANGTYTLPAVLLAQYRALAPFQWPSEKEISEHLRDTGIFLIE